MSSGTYEVCLVFLLVYMDALVADLVGLLCHFFHSVKAQSFISVNCCLKMHRNLGNSKFALFCQLVEVSEKVQVTDRRNNVQIL